MEQQPFDRDKDEPAVTPGQRNSGRDSLLLTATVKIEGRPDCQVRVRNLSEGGMMAEYPYAIDIGSAVSIDLRGIGWVKGTIAWATDGRVGIAFESSIDPLAARKPVGKRAQTGAKPKFKPLMPERR